MGCVSDSGSEAKAGTQGTIRAGGSREAVPLWAAHRDKETHRSTQGWRWLGKLPGRSGTGGNQAETQQGQRKTAGVSLESTRARAWVLLGLPTWMEGDISSSAASQLCAKPHRSWGANYCLLLFPACFLTPLSPFLLPAQCGGGGEGER